MHRRFQWALAAAALFAVIALSVHFWPQPPEPQSIPSHASDTTSGTRSSVVELNFLSPRPRPESKAARALTVGEEVRTGKGERCRLSLPDRSVLYVNDNSAVKLTADRRLALSRGEVFLEVAPQERSGTGAAQFVVQTAQRSVVALGTKFAVQAGDAGTGVLVTQGKVQVSDLPAVVAAGQQVPPGSAEARPAQRSAYLLDWTRDLVAAAESPLVPESQHSGGSLVAVDPSGQEAKLSLRKFHIDVHIEDGFARTTIDQTYFNHHPWRLEGTFYFPLPPDASLSRLAMYVANGKECDLMEGGMAERDYARTVFENIVRKQKDPALLEWVDGSTFKMRVFPLEGRQEKRIVLSYTQKLDALYGRSNYRFPAGHNLQVVGDWSFHGRLKGGAEFPWSSLSHELQAKPEGKDLLLDTQAKGVKIDRDVQLSFVDPDFTHENVARFSSAEHEGARYLMLRFRPDLSAVANLKSPSKQHRDWVFLFESSADRNPLLARVQIDVIRTLLANAEHDDTFNIVTAGTDSQTFSREAQKATPQNIAAVIAFLERTHLIGALDLKQAIEATLPLLKAGTHPCLVHVGSGIPALGERREDVLARKLPDDVPYVGVAVGKHWSRPFMKLAADRSGGAVTQINPDEPVAWRAFELSSLLNAPRLMNLKVVDNAEKVQFLCTSSALAQGEEVCALARIAPGAELPQTVTVAGTLDRRPLQVELPVANVAGRADYLPRTWAKLEIDRLLAENAQKHKARLIELSKAMYVMTPFTSLLVLENEAMYAEYKVDRGRKDHWAMYPCPPKIPIVYEPDPSQGIDVRNAPKELPKPSEKPTREQVLQTIVIRTAPQLFGKPNENANRPTSILASQLFGQGNSVSVPDGGTVFLGGLRLPIANVPPELLNSLDYYPPARSLIVRGSSRVDHTRADIWIGSPEVLSVDLGRPTQTRLGDGSAVPRADPIYPMPLYHDRPETGGFFVYGEFLYYHQTNPLRGEMINPSQNQPGGPTPLQRYARYLPQTAGNGIMPGTVLNVNYAQLQLPNMQNNQVNPALGLAAAARPLGGFGAGGFPGGGFGSGLGFGASPFGQSNAGAGPAQHGVSPYFNLMGTPGQQIGLNYLGLTMPAQTQTVTQQFLPLSLDPRWAEQLAENLKAKDDVSRLEKARHDVETKLEAAMADAKLKIRSPDEFEIFMEGILEFPRGPREVNRERHYVPAWMNGPTAKRIIPTKQNEDFATAFFAQFLNRDDHGFLPYRRPAFVVEDRYFTDLVSHAPAMNTTWADIQAVLETEAAPDLSTVPGRIDAGAAQLIAQARSAGWQKVTFPAAGSQLAFAIVFDGSGRYSYEQALPNGLREQAVCDGKTLLHLYPELGLGARRQMGRVYRTVLRKLVPWVLPPVEDLARGADVTCDDPRIVRIAPRGAASARDAEGKPRNYLCIELLFAEGRVSERRIVEMPSGKVLQRETYGTNGLVQCFNAEGKQAAKLTLTLSTAEAPVLAPDTRSLVVLPLPYRTSQHIEQIKKTAGVVSRQMEETQRRASLATLFASDPAQMARAFDGNISEKKLGFATLVEASGRQSNPFDRGLDGAWSQYCLGLNQPVAPKDGLVHRLYTFQQLYLAWGKSETVPGDADDKRKWQRALEYVKQNKDFIHGWLLLNLLLDKVGGERQNALAVADACRHFEDMPGLEYTARYERARCLYLADHEEEGRKAFVDLYNKTIQAGDLPPVDSSFRAILKYHPARGPDLWMPLIRDTAAKLIKQDCRLAVIALAWQCREVHDPELADALVTQALANLPGKDSLVVTFAGIKFFAQTGQREKADDLLQKALEHESAARNPWLWRLGSAMAGQRGKLARSLSCLDRALQIEHRDLPPVINLEQVRRDYGQLLAGYQQLAQAMKTLETPPRSDFVSQVVRVADQWRELDTDPTAACQAAAQVLTLLGECERAWQYVTTPLAGHANESPALQTLAQNLRNQGDLALAERAYALAAQGDPANAAIAEEHAQMLEQAGKAGEARKVRELSKTKNVP